MDQQINSPLERIKQCIDCERSFVLQGGAGSGKTETLKSAVAFFADSFPDKRIACITHTNKAADEILDRVGPTVEVSTIHSFIHKLISPYKRNLLQILPELFCLPLFEELGLEHYDDEKSKKLEEHKRFKAHHESLANKRTIVFQEKTEKPAGKRDYDKNPESYNAALNAKISELNEAIRNSILEHDFKDVEYNESPFDSFKNATFGHDGLIKLAALLFSRYENLGRIVRDKYDCIFIDEYQDTHEEIIHSLIYSTPDKGLTIGLFGDSEQAIYEDGIGSAKSLIDNKSLLLIEKEDNYRCSPQVIDIANKFRNDGLIQKVAFKEVDGIIENAEDREGSAVFYYSIKPPKPQKPSPPGKTASESILDNYEKEKSRYDELSIKYKQDISRRLEALTSLAQKNIGSHVLLKLPNKSVAHDAKFGTLYEIFDRRFRDTRDQIKKHLDRLQFGQLCQILQLFELSSSDNRAYNKLIALLKKQGLFIRTNSDKRNIYQKLEQLLSSDDSAFAALDKAIKSKLISISESHCAYLSFRDSELKRIEEDSTVKAFKQLRAFGHNTEKQMYDYIKANDTTTITAEDIEENYDQLSRDLKIEKFYSELFGKDLKFKEILAFYKYESDDSNFMTMHKTKGTGIENVIVVLEEFNWYKYDFSSCFREKTDNPARQAITRKLLYVACSRAKKNLICTMLLNSPSEVDNIKKYFSDVREFDLSKNTDNI